MHAHHTTSSPPFSSFLLSPPSPLISHALLCSVLLCTIVVTSSTHSPLHTSLHPALLGVPRSLQVGMNTIIFNWDKILMTSDTFGSGSIDCEVETTQGSMGRSLTRRSFELNSGMAVYKGAASTLCCLFVCLFVCFCAQHNTTWHCTALPCAALLCTAQMSYCGMSCHGTPH